MKPTIAALSVFYDEKMLADAQSFSPSAGKPAEVVESWRGLGIPLDIRQFQPVSDAQICLAHDPGYVAGILALDEANGFGNVSASVAASLPYTCGAMLAAAREAVANRAVAVAPCSGFHHAHYASAGGYCTFNGLVIAACALREAGLARRVGILDFDQHYGDGTDDIIDRLRLRFIEHCTAGRRWHRKGQAKEFLSCIPSMLDAMADCDVILYQAGADPHVDDPLGGWLTTSQLAWRDRAVFEASRALGVPVAWNLAGGYQSPLRKVLDIHDNTLRACWAVYGEGVA